MVAACVWRGDGEGEAEEACTVVPASERLVQPGARMTASRQTVSTTMIVSDRFMTVVFLNSARLILLFLPACRVACSRQTPLLEDLQKMTTDSKTQLSARLTKMRNSQKTGIFKGLLVMEIRRPVFKQWRRPSGLCQVPQGKNTFQTRQQPLFSFISTKNSGHREYQVSNFIVYFFILMTHIKYWRAP